MDLKVIANKIEAAKSLSPDERIDLLEVLTDAQNEVRALFEALAQVPDEEPKDAGAPDPRAAFVDSLMASQVSLGAKR